MHNAESLNVGDIVGIEFYSYSYKKGNHVSKATVVKKNKLTITVRCESSGEEMIFNISNAKRRGAHKWSAPGLVSEERMAEAHAALRASRIAANKIEKRRVLIEELSRSINDDAAFAVALEALNQRSYAPAGA